MSLLDTGPLVAAIDSNDSNHGRCLEALKASRLPLLTSMPCLTEAMYLLGRSAGTEGQEALWTYLRSGVVHCMELGDRGLELAANYMRRFRDVPCDFADASLLAIAEMTGDYEVVSIDGHFFAYRVHEKSLTVTPGPRGKT